MGRTPKHVETHLWKHKKKYNKNMTLGTRKHTRNTHL